MARHNIFKTILILSLSSLGCLAFNVEKSKKIFSETGTRREIFEKTAVAIATASVFAAPQIASASGGATAGKYTTIPIAKRRYYGRVKQGVHDFLAMGPNVLEKDMSLPKIQFFFDEKGVVVVEAKDKSIKGSCTKKDYNCKGREVRDSRYNDMKTSMYLLGNAFRINQQRAPDKLPTVILAKAFFKEMDAMEMAIKKPKKNDVKSVGHYVAALDIIEKYLDLVELPPTERGYYDQEFSTLVGERARIM